MTFEEFRDEAFRLCTEVNPRASINVERISWLFGGERQREHYQVSCKGLDRSVPQFEYFKADTTEEALEKLRSRISDARQADGDPEWRQQVAKAMGLL